MGIWEFIAKDNPDAATRAVEAVYETFKLLAANPEMAKLRRFRSRMVIYRALPACIEVLHVYHGARDIKALFEE